MQKSRFSRGLAREYLHCLRTLQAEGIRVDMPDEWVQLTRLLDVVIAPPPISMAFDFLTGGAGYAVWLRLISRTRCMLEDCALAVPWDDDVIIQSLDQRKPRCEFGSLVFSPDEILNGRIENTLRFPRAGHLVEGVILGRGAKRIPDRFPSGRSVPFTLTLYDQHGEETIEDGYLSIADRVRRQIDAIEFGSEDLFGNPRSAFAGKSQDLNAKLADRYRSYKSFRADAEEDGSGLPNKKQQIEVVDRPLDGLRAR